MTLSSILRPSILRPSTPLDFASSNSPQTSRGTQPSAVQQSRISAFRKQQADITIVTAEGDRVTLSSTSQTHALYSAYNRTGSHGQGSTQSLSVQQSHNLSISIEGNLNEQELRDIRKALRAIRKVGKEVAAGEIGQAQQGAHAISKSISTSGTISSLQATLQYEQVLAQQHQTVESQSNRKPEVAPAHETEHEEDAPIEKPVRAHQLAERISEILEKTSIEPKKLIRPVRKLFRRFSRRLEQQQGEDSSNLKLVRQIKSEVLHRLRELARADRQPEAEGEHEANPELSENRALAKEQS